MKRNILTLAIAAAALSSCSDKLDIAPPNAITDEQIMELLRSGDEEKIALVMNSMANAMPTTFNFYDYILSASSHIPYSYPQALDVMRSFEGNDIVVGDKTLSGYGGDEYALNNFQSTESTKNVPYWNYCWMCITAANKMLNYLDDETVGQNKSLMKHKAAGLSVRAYFYHYLMENYQDAYMNGGQDKLGVPLYDVYNPSQENKERASATETYNFIKNDIDNAIELYKEAGVGFTKDDLYDIDLAVAYFIQARVALWSGDWATCISACDNILAQYPDLMSESVYGSRLSYDENGELDVRPEKNGFTNNSVNPEVIFGWDASQNTHHHHQTYMNCFSEGTDNISAAPSGVIARIDERLYNKIADGDYRKDCFMEDAFGDYDFPTKTPQAIPSLTNLKFAANKGYGSDDKKTAGVATFCQFRTSEALLMKAESQAEQGNDAAAIETLNKLLAARTKSGAATLTCDNYPSMGGLSTLEKVQLQWRIEMWGESGREYYNNKRWNIAVDRASSSNHVVKQTLPVADMTLQIPEDEMLYNKKCVQN